MIPTFLIGDTTRNILIGSAIIGGLFLLSSAVNGSSQPVKQTAQQPKPQPQKKPALNGTPKNKTATKSKKAGTLKV
ncbi:MAG: hypothetical protein N4A71_05700 [Carboxylicivirga sp.]|jgi:hypothetical protein|nr:hypothetical protein [Carboxylicivirga sp.]